MKLAEALIERSDLQKKLQQDRERLINNATVQEGLSPNEKPEDLLGELYEDTKRYEYLITHINMTNELTKTKGGETISSLITKRNILETTIEILRTFISAGSVSNVRLTHSEIRTVTTFNVAQMQKEVSKFSKQLREVDTSIQEMNWLTELL